MRATIAAVALAALVVLAGCAGILGSGESNATTAGPGTTGLGATTTGSYEGVDLPPGVEAGAAVDETKLLATHRSRLDGTVFRDDLRIDQRGTGQFRVVRVVGEDAVYERVDAAGNVTECRRLGPETFRLETSGPRAGVHYTSDEHRRTSNCGATASFSLSFYALAGEYRPNGTVTRGGERLVRLTATRPNRSNRYGANFEEFRATMLVDERGVIHRITGRGVAGGEDRTVVTDFEYSLDRSVESVPTPGWTGSVPRGEVSLLGDGRTAALAVAQGSIPEGTDLRLELDRTYVATTETAIGPGETVYLRVVETGSGRRLELSRELPEGGDAVDLSGREILVRTTVGNATLEFYAGPPGGR